MTQSALVMPFRSAVVILAVTLWTRVTAQDSGAAQEIPAEITLEELDGKPCAEGQKSRVSGRYVELRQEEVVLLESPVKLVIANAELRRDLLSVAATNENISLVVECHPGDGAGKFFEIRGVLAGSSEAEIFRAGITRLKSAGSDGLETLFELTARMHRIAEKIGNKELSALARSTWIEGVELREKSLPANDVDGRLTFIRQTQKVLQDRALTVNLLAQLEQRFPYHDPIRQELLDLNCRKYRGRWLTYEEFKSLQGYVQVANRWVSRQEKRFLEAVETHRRRSGQEIERPKMEEEYRILAGRKELAVGMSAREVQRAIGFPARVYRVERDTKDYDLWVYPDRSLYYSNGVLFKVDGTSAPQAATPSVPKSP